MKAKRYIPMNTLEKAMWLARILLRDLENQESKASRSYKVFTALTTGERESLAAFFIWRARGEVIRELLAQR